eukprot:m.419947 g.419947  ORF g.419947 m.419947 type:complete len:127 (+) comp56629_c0_seq26:178-558(+)
MHQIGSDSAGRDLAEDAFVGGPPRSIPAPSHRRLLSGSAPNSLSNPNHRLPDCQQQPRKDCKAETPKQLREEIKNVLATYTAAKLQCAQTAASLPHPQLSVLPATPKNKRTPHHHSSLGLSNLFEH